jgi:membrane protease YdiL (CAAX protease family)
MSATPTDGDRDDDDDNDEPSEDEPAPSQLPEPLDRVLGGAFTAAGSIVIAVGFALYLAFSPTTEAIGAGGAAALAPLAIVYAALAALAYARIRRRGETWLLRPRAGDLTLGALVAFLLYGLAVAVHSLATPPGSPRFAWVLRVYLALGDPRSDARHLVALAAGVVGLLEELTWRGLVTPALERRVGALRGGLLGAVLFAIAHVPTAFALGDPIAGPNPLVAGAALGCGLVWSYLRWRVDRLAPALISHALFTWLVVELPLVVR